MLIKRYLLLVGVLVAFGLVTVRWKSRTLSMGYEAARLERRLNRALEEERQEQARLARLTAPAAVADKAKGLGLQPSRDALKTAMAMRRKRGSGDRSVAMVERDRPGGNW